MLHRRFSRPALVTSSALLTLVLAGSGCTRASSDQGPAAENSTAASSPTGPATGTFGSVQHVCGPGSGTGGSGRGIDGKTIRVGVLGDPGNTVAPGLGQEFFDVADAFAKWCNAAGGINGRTIVVDKLDAKLFNVAAEVIKACQRDFMLVGGGNGLDAVGVKPRLACKLGQIPGYTVSPEAGNAGLQVTPTQSTPLHYQAGILRLLADAYPIAKQGLGIAGSSLASLTPQGLRAQEAWQRLGYKVSTVQPRPAQVDNYRSWMEQFKAEGAKADFEITASDAQPLFTGMKDVGFDPAFVLFGQATYNSQTVNAARSVGRIPPTYVGLSSLPWELSSQYPVLRQAKTMLQAVAAHPQYDTFTSLAFNAWALWAQSASACGQHLTQDCVLQKAGSHNAWTGGAMFGPTNTAPALHDFTDCVLFIRLTPYGWVYDKSVTKPNSGPYNCAPENLMSVKSYGG